MQRNDEVQTDLRTFLAAVEEGGEVKHVAGAHWNRELGAVTEVLYREKVDKSPLLLFDEVPGYGKGMRCLYGMLGSPLRLALGLGIDPAQSGDRRTMLDTYRRRIKRQEPIPPRFVDDGPVMENIDRDGDVDLLKFPVPIHHEHDERAVYRDCLRRGYPRSRQRADQYRHLPRAGERRRMSPPPISPTESRAGSNATSTSRRAGPARWRSSSASIPATYIAARYTLSDNVPELDWAGGLVGRPIDCIEGELTGLPFPANSEIVLEGEVSPDETAMEGPFGEWTGYYAGDAREEPVIKIKRVYYRNDPILTCAASQKPPHSHLFERCFIRSAGLLDSLEGAGIPDVTGVWVHQAGAGRTFVVVAIRQRYFGHANQVGLVASQVNPTGYVGRYIVVVDDDIDPTDMHDVIWAMGTRSDPEDRFHDPRPELVVQTRYDGDRRETVQLARRHRCLHPL